MAFYFHQPQYGPTFAAPRPSPFSYPSGESYYGDRGYLAALAAQQEEQRVREQYVYAAQAARREELARRQEIEYQRAVALENKRHEDILRGLAQRSTLNQRWHPQADGPPPLIYDSASSTPHVSPVQSYLPPPPPSRHYTPNPLPPFAHSMPALVPYEPTMPSVSRPPTVETPRAIPRTPLRNPHSEAVAFASRHTSDGNDDDDSDTAILLKLKKEPTPEQIRRVLAIFEDEAPAAPAVRKPVAESQPQAHHKGKAPAQPQPQVQPPQPTTPPRRAPRNRVELLKALYAKANAEMSKIERRSASVGTTDKPVRPTEPVPQVPQTPQASVKVQAAEVKPKPATAVPTLAPAPAPAPVSPARALTVISSIEHDFIAIHGSFEFPETLEFSTPAQAGESPQLTHGAINLPLRVYEQQLTNLLSKLDEVDSEGLQTVRDARKKLVKEIEAVLEEMDRKKDEVWERLAGSPKSVAVEVPVAEPAAVTAEPVAEVAVENAEPEPAPAAETAEEAVADAPLEYVEPTALTSEDLVVDGYDASPVGAVTDHSGPIATEISSAPAVSAEQEVTDVAQLEEDAVPADISSSIVVEVPHTNEDAAEVKPVDNN